MLGMDMMEWRHLSGLADPYALALAEAAAKAGVPPSVQLEASPLSNLPDSPLDVHHGDDDEPKVSAPAGNPKKARLANIKSAARKLAAKTRGAADKAGSTKAIDRHRQYLDAMKQKKAAGKAEDIDADLLWAVFLEDIGTTTDEFADLLDLAVENDDDDMAIELISVEDQLDEILGGIGAGIAKAGQVVGQGAMKVGGALARGAVAATKGVANAAGQVAGTAAKGFKAGMGGGAPAGGSAPAPAPAPAAPAPAAPAAPAAGASAPMATQSKPAAAATPAPAAQAAGGAPASGAPAAQPAPSMQKKQPGLLGTLGRGIGKVARGVAGMAAAPVKAVGSMAGQVAQGAQAGYRGEDMEAFEQYLSDEFGITAEQYIEMCDDAYASNDEEAISEMHQLDEIFGMWKKKKEAEAAGQREKVMSGWKAARDVVAKHGASATKAASVRGKQVGAPPAGSGTSVHAKKAESVEDVAMQILEESGALAPRERVNDMKMLMAQQLQFSGYTDAHINSKKK